MISSFFVICCIILQCIILKTKASNIEYNSLLNIFGHDRINIHYNNVDHYEHSDDQHVSECQACEENVDIKITLTRDNNTHQKVSPVTNLISRFVSFNKSSNHSRAPPLN